jgi:paraquat-inducible protein A
MRLKACRCCGLIQHVPTLTGAQRAGCCRCDRVFPRPADRNAVRTRTAALATAALILLPAALWFPILDLERFGHHTSSGIVGGCTSLFHDGHWLLAGIILLAAIVFPVVKLVALLIGTRAGVSPDRRHAAATWRFLEVAGRWSMLDVLLVAILTAVVKLGDVVRVRPGTGAALFVGVVLLSLAAGASFDPHAVWEDDVP